MEKLKKKWNRGFNWIICSLVFWILETIVFLCIDGWHIKPIRISELILKSLVDIGFVVGMYYIFSVIFEIVDVILKQETED